MTGGLSPAPPSSRRLHPGPDSPELLRVGLQGAIDLHPVAGLHLGVRVQSSPEHARRRASRLSTRPSPPPAPRPLTASRSVVPRGTDTRLRTCREGSAHATSTSMVLGVHLRPDSAVLLPGATAEGIHEGIRDPAEHGIEQRVHGAAGRTRTRAEAIPDSPARRAYRSATARRAARRGRRRESSR